eukprot:gene14242-biopygen555
MRAAPQKRARSGRRRWAVDADRARAAAPLGTSSAPRAAQGGVQGKCPFVPHVHLPETFRPFAGSIKTSRPGAAGPGTGETFWPAVRCCPQMCCPQMCCRQMCCRQMCCRQMCCRQMCCWPYMPKVRKVGEFLQFLEET